MHVLLIVAHGSKRTASNEEIAKIAHTLEQRLEKKFAKVNYALLEFSPPTIGNALDDAFTHGAQQVTVLPYFIAAGKHVGKDIPQAISNAMEHWPDKEIHLKEHIGAHEGMLDLLESAC